MADTYTANLNLTLPEVGSSTDTWGTKLNADLAILDPIFAPAGGGTSVGLHVGDGKALVIDGTGALSVAATCTASFGGTVNIANLVAGNVYTKAEANAAFLTQAAGDTRYVNTTGDGMSGGLSATELYSSGLLGCAGTFTASGAANVGGNMTANGAVITNYIQNNGALAQTGNITITNGAPTISFADNDWGTIQLHCNGGNIGFLNNGGGWAFRVQNDGTAVATGNLAAYSDARLKTNVRTIMNALDLVNRLRGVSYDRIDSGDHRVGLIAQEAQLVVPEIVLKDQDGMLSIAYGDLVGVLVEAINELTNRVRELESNQ